MDNSDKSRDELSDAVSAAAQHFRERKAAQDAASEKNKPKSRVGLLVVGLAVLTVVAGWDWYLLTRPPEPLPVVEQELDLSWFVLGAARLVESHRGEDGRLPTAAELAGLLDEAVTYSVVGEDYLLVAESNGVTVEYRSEIPVEEWISARSFGSGGGLP